MKYDSFHVGIEDPGGQCIVCEKTLRQGQETARLKDGEMWVILCCPLCLSAYQEKPEFYLSLRALRFAEQPRRE